ncbi:MAG: 3-methyl-2-oxobutanoate hydroxymethyltransferase [Candidatus Eremiobacteraeota bacterium]|nr:3-methyl-2-oxobutanoate hydroxymethyltransferase [Candidatus Eremiobacteraeota bacterium]MCW5866198.1 3-methyl-2-oxobutanoate hydroxymethyltransferase [Candidatus Eremiobacteraeota bacterium]
MKSVLDFKKGQHKITMLTCYDYWSARLLNDSPVDCILVGDSGAMVMHGYPDTVAATSELMALHTRAVKLGAPDRFVIGDMPFLSFRGSLDRALDCVMQLMQAGAQAVKLEGAAGHLPLVKHLTESGVPVMGHLGLTPQSVHALGGFKVQAKTEQQAQRLKKDAQDLQAAGCFALVLECVPTQVAKEVTEQLDIPTIGIGAGPHCDGQVLVLQDMLGAQTHFKPKFVRHFADLAGTIKQAVNHFNEEVQSGAFPSPQESYA